MTKTRRLTRRQAIALGAAGVGGLALTRVPRDLPPTYGHVLRMGDNLTYAVHRAVLQPGQSLAREYGREAITSFPAVGTTDPGTRNSPPAADYQRLQAGGFGDYELSVEGRVARPRTFSLAALQRLPARTQITRHTCEEGWTAIGEWTGVPLAAVLEAVGALPTARYVVFHSFDEIINSLDMLDALHPQTLLAYGMNGRALPVAHGAPVRLRAERHVGYKSLKYLRRIVVSDTFDDGGSHGDIQNGWAWYTGI
jgi:DMSO/TMAO reductase YedYZ molybdopterin-dependent catalytic subunit